MPKAAVHEDCDPARAKDDVGSPGQVDGMKAEAKASGVQRLTDLKLGLGVFAPYSRHLLRAREHPGDYAYLSKYSRAYWYLTFSR